MLLALDAEIGLVGPNGRPNRPDPGVPRPTPPAAGGRSGGARRARSSSPNGLPRRSVGSACGRRTTSARSAWPSAGRGPGLADRPRRDRPGPLPRARGRGAPDRGGARGLGDPGGRRRRGRIGPVRHGPAGHGGLSEARRPGPHGAGVEPGPRATRRREEPRERPGHRPSSSMANGTGSTLPTRSGSSTPCAGGSGSAGPRRGAGPGTAAPAPSWSTGDRRSPASPWPGGRGRRRRDHRGDRSDPDGPRVRRPSNRRPRCSAGTAPPASSSP